MTSTPELAMLIQRERVRASEQERLARFAARLRECCSPSLLTRIGRALRVTPAAC